MIDQAADMESGVSSNQDKHGWPTLDQPTEQEMQPFRERKWTSNQVRRIMKQNTQRILGKKIGTSNWRQMSKAISNRYLGTKHNPADGGEDEEDEDGIDDVSNARDLQAGHTSAIAGAIYAREMEQGLGGILMMREEFRGVSGDWH